MLRRVAQSRRHRTHVRLWGRAVRQSGGHRVAERPDDLQIAIVALEKRLNRRADDVRIVAASGLRNRKRFNILQNLSIDTNFFPKLVKLCSDKTNTVLCILAKNTLRIPSDKGLRRQFRNNGITCKFKYRFNCKKTKQIKCLKLSKFTYFHEANMISCLLINLDNNIALFY